MSLNSSLEPPCATFSHNGMTDKSQLGYPASEEEDQNEALPAVPVSCLLCYVVLAVSEI